ncbi:MAG: hypothetical protein K2P59_05985 [Acetatifactor sp.]|nr:hypothetical protein [Acetatifactor sp.]
MSIMEIVLLVAGGIVFTLSFMIPVKKDEGSEEARGLAKDEIKALVSEELEAVRGHVDDVVEEAVTYSIEKTERSLERLSNEKIMAVNEYSDTVLAEIHKNHEEVMFLYDMLNDKHINLKNTVSEVNRTVKEVKETKKEAEEVVNTFQRLAPEAVNPLKANGMNMPQTSASQQVFASAPTHVAASMDAAQQRMLAQQKMNMPQRADLSRELNGQQDRMRQGADMSHPSVTSQMAAAAAPNSVAAQTTKESKVPVAPQFQALPQGHGAARKSAADTSDVRTQELLRAQTAAVLPSAVQQSPGMRQEIAAAETAQQIPGMDREAAGSISDMMSQVPDTGREISVPMSDAALQTSDTGQGIVPVSDIVLQTSGMEPEGTAPMSDAVQQLPDMGQDVFVPGADTVSQIPGGTQEMMSSLPGGAQESFVMEQEAAEPFSDAVLQAPAMMYEGISPDMPQTSVREQESAAGAPAGMPGEVAPQVSVAVPPIFASAPVPVMGQLSAGAPQASPVPQQISSVSQQVSPVPQQVSSVPQAAVIPPQEYAVPPVFASAPVPMTAQMPVVSQPYVQQQPYTEPVPESGLPLPPGSISFTQETDRQGRNYNDRILEMYKEGKSKVAIAKELNLGVGEVKLVIDLYKNRSEK